MVRETGDLWPQSSGSASLGAEMTNGGFTGEVRPFAHVHMNSGIFHAINGVSGIVRFQRNEDALLVNGKIAFGFSFDGGKYFPCQIAQGDVLSGIGFDIFSPHGGMRAISSGAMGFISLNGACNHQAINGPVTYGATGLGGGNAGDIISSADQQTSMSTFQGSGKLEYRFGPHQSWHIKQSHTSTGGPSNDGYWPIPHSGQIRAMVASGSIQKINGKLGPEITIAAGAGISVDNTVANTITIGTNLPVAVNSINGGVGSIGIHAANGITFTDDGAAVNTQFLINGAALSGLQAQYNIGNRIHTSAIPGDLEIIANTAKTKFAGTTTAEINLSGVYTRPTSSLEMGDMYMMAHSAMDNIGAFSNVTDLDNARARSLGLATPIYNTGSGMINLSNGSGIMQCLNSTVMIITKVAQTLPLVAASPCSDMNYFIGTGLSSGVITILTPGLYQANYKVLSGKTVGTNPQTVQTSATLNGSTVLGSLIHSFHYDALNAANMSASCSLLFNANAGDLFRLNTLSTLDGADNCSLSLRGGLLILQKIGPKRSTF